MATLKPGAAGKDENGGAERRIKRPSGLVDEVFRLIRADIIALRIPPNSRVSVDNLVRELGVSQTPIREALSMLEGVGLVYKKHAVGYWTAPKLNRKQFDDLYEIRLLIEPYAARRAAERGSAESLERIRALTDQMKPGDSRASYDLFADQDAKFHSLVAEASGNALIVEALDRLHTHLHIFRLRFHSEVTTEAFAEHALVMQALELHSGSTAEAAMREHIEKSYKRLVSFVSEE